MSLNWREIDAVLAEWSLEGLWLKRVRQPDYRCVILEFAGGGQIELIKVVLAPPFVRLHRLEADFPIPKALPKPPRFAAVLKSRLEGSRLSSVGQLGRDRIVRFAFHRRGTFLYLHTKLWGNAGNLLLVDSNGIIIDAFSRRPKRREAPGESWPPEGIGTSNSTDSDRFVLRELPGEGDWNSRIGKYYRELEVQTDGKRRLEVWQAYLDKREAALTSKAAGLIESRRRFESQLGDRHWGDIIMAHLHELEKGTDALEADDWNHSSASVSIHLDPALSPQENAERYYRRHKRAVRGLARLEEDLIALKTAEKHIAELRQKLKSGKLDNIPLDAHPPGDPRGKESGKKSLPGLWIDLSPYLIAVGRNARESDTLLRRWARGNDLWLHIRDRPGGHVFVRAPRGKTVPLEILLDAGNLALVYSKGKSAIEADLYYTAVKHLRRAKNGKAASVLPTQEKNLRVKLNKKRLETLKSLAESG